MARKKLY